MASVIRPIMPMRVKWVGKWVEVVGAGRFELPTSWSQTRRPAAGPRPRCVKVKEDCGLNAVSRQKAVKGMVSPERVELSSLAPEASTLSVELRGPD